MVLGMSFCKHFVAAALSHLTLQSLLVRNVYTYIDFGSLYVRLILYGRVTWSDGLS